MARSIQDFQSREDLDASDGGDFQSANSGFRREEAATTRATIPEGSGSRSRKRTEVGVPSGRKRNRYICRGSPRRWIEALKGLTRHHEYDVREMGFGYLLSMQISSVPPELARWLIDSFLETRVALRLDNKRELDVDDEDVNAILGLPCGGERIEWAVRKRQISSELREWRHSHGAETFEVPLATVIKSFSDHPHGGLEFKRNFLVVLSTLLVYPGCGKFANQSFFEQVIKHPDDAFKFNWCQVVKEGIVKAKKYWGPNVEYYGGPIAFMTLFYLDKVVFMGREPTRRRPAILYLDDDELKLRYNMESKKGQFGEGRVVPRFPSSDLVVLPTSVPMSDDEATEEEEQPDSFDVEGLKELDAVYRRLANELDVFKGIYNRLKFKTGATASQYDCAGTASTQWHFLEDPFLQLSNVKKTMSVLQRRYAQDFSEEVFRPGSPSSPVNLGSPSSPVSPVNLGSPAILESEQERLESREKEPTSHCSPVKEVEMPECVEIQQESREEPRSMSLVREVDMLENLEKEALERLESIQNESASPMSLVKETERLESPQKETPCPCSPVKQSKRPDLLQKETDESSSLVKETERLESPHKEAPCPCSPVKQSERPDLLQKEANESYSLVRELERLESPQKEARCLCSPVKQSERPDLLQKDASESSSVVKVVEEQHWLDRVLPSGRPIRDLMTD